MKRIVFSTLVFFSSCILYAQEDLSVTVEEVTVKSSKVVSKADCQTIYPTAVQKESSDNGYSFLQKLSLPNIRIEDASHSVTAIDNRGYVQLRINGIIVGKSEMVSLNPMLISKIDFIDNPGLKYGDDVAYVIDIVTVRDENGYAIGAELTPTLTSKQGDGTAYGKWNVGNSEFSLSYGFSGQKLKGSSEAETAEYILNDGSTHLIERDDLMTLYKSRQHDISLTYNFTDSATQVFQISLSESAENVPDDISIKRITEGDSCYTATKKEKSKSHSPVADIYFFRQITPRQSISANVVETYINTNESYFYDEGKAYQDNVKGKTVSTLSEVIYENKLNPFAFSLGLNYRHKHTKNSYSGDASALTEMGQNYLYAFGEIKGIIKNFRYSVGAGASHIHYNQNEHNYNYWTFRPKATFTYNFASKWQLSYFYQMCEKVSRIAMVSEATIRTNSMELKKGNPDLKPSHDTEHQLRLLYNGIRLQASAECYFKQCDKPNMALYERTPDNQFVYTQINQKEIDVLHAMAYANCWLMPEKLQISAYGALQRCFNYGFDYTHCYTSFNCACKMTAYLNSFTLQVYYDNGYRFLEGETKGFNGAETFLKTSYKHGNLMLSLTLVNPLSGKYKSYESELLNRNLHKTTAGFSKDKSNCVLLCISWSMSHGKKHNSAAKTINMEDTDTGIIKQQ